MYIEKCKLICLHVYVRLCIYAPAHEYVLLHVREREHMANYSGHYQFTCSFNKQLNNTASVFAQTK